MEGKSVVFFYVLYLIKLIEFTNRGAAMHHTANDYQVDVVAVYYHWRVGVCCRKELDNSQAKIASVEPGKKQGRKIKSISSMFTLFFAYTLVLLCIPPLVNYDVSLC